MSTIIESIERRQLRSRVPRFAAGDRVRVHFQVIEGNRRRTQVFEGVVIKRQGHGVRETFTVRKQSFGVGVERTFPLHSPKIERLEVAGRGDVRRAKLYYLRGRVGKAARVAERRWGIEEDLIAAEPEALDTEGETVEEAETADIPAEPDGDDTGGHEIPSDAEAKEPRDEAPAEESSDEEPVEQPATEATDEPAEDAADEPGADASEPAEADDENASS